MIFAHDQMNHWLAELNASSGSELKLSEDGYCNIISEDGVEITLVAEMNSEVFRVLIDIMPIPLDDHIRLYEACLAMNLDQGYTGGASIALDLAGQSVVLSYMRSVEETSFTQFYNLLQNLLSVANKIITDLNFSVQDLQGQLQQAQQQANGFILQV